jgi:hypothetical protein
MASLNVAAQFDSTGAVTVTASPSALLALAGALDTESDTIIELTRIVAVTPYVAAATAIRVRIEAAPGVSISREDDQLIVAGHPEAIAILAQNVSALASDPSARGDHMHIEYFPEHFYLRPGGLPLVVEALE